MFQTRPQLSPRPCFYLTKAATAIKPLCGSGKCLIGRIEQKFADQLRADLIEAEKRSGSLKSTPLILETMDRKSS